MKSQLKYLNIFIKIKKQGLFLKMFLLEDFVATLTNANLIIVKLSQIGIQYSFLFATSHCNKTCKLL